MKKTAYELHFKDKSYISFDLPGLKNGTFVGRLANDFLLIQLRHNKSNKELLRTIFYAKKQVKHNFIDHQLTIIEG